MGKAARHTEPLEEGAQRDGVATRRQVGTARLDLSGPVVGQLLARGESGFRLVGPWLPRLLRRASSIHDRGGRPRMPSGVQ